MILPDVNVLIYAFRPGVPQHAQCHAWLQRVIESEEPFGLATLVLAAVVRVTTGPTYALRSALEDAMGFCDDLIKQPHCRLVEPGPAHWSIFRRLCVETNTRGPLVTDAWLAALAIESGCEWITMDRDYARFPGLRWRTPNAA